MLTVRLHGSVAELHPRAWDALGHDPFSEHAVLGALEHAALPGVDLWYLTVADGEEHLVAAAPISRIAIDGARLTHGLFHRLIGAVRTVRPQFLKTRLMVCGTPLSVANPAVRLAAGADVAGILRALAQRLVRHASEHDASWCVFKEFTEAELPSAQAALNGGTGWLLAPSEPNSRMSIAWDDWEAYLASLRSDYRYKLRKALRRFATAGGEVDVVPLAVGYDDDVHRLYEAVLARAPIQLEHLTARFFLELGRALGPRACLIRFHCSGRVVGWVAAVVDGDTVYDVFHGIDYEANGRCALYFNQLASVIRFAVERGARSLSLGQSTEVAKGRFGAEPVPLWFALRPRSSAVSYALRAGRRVLFPTKQIPRHHVFRATAS